MKCVSPSARAPLTTPNLTIIQHQLNLFTILLQSGPPILQFSSTRLQALVMLLDSLFCPELPTTYTGLVCSFRVGYKPPVHFVRNLFKIKRISFGIGAVFDHDDKVVIWVRRNCVAGREIFLYQWRFVGQCLYMRAIAVSYGGHSVEDDAK